MARRYTLWKGRNQFALGGKLMFGSDTKHLVATNLLLTAPSALFCVFVLPVYDHAAILIGTTVLLWLYGMLTLWQCALTDPGIIPRQSPDLEAEAPLEEGVKDYMASKYCETCNIYRPPRSKHCRACDNCVERFDHHCPWTGNCVGLRNYKFFLRFVCTCTLLAGYILVVCIVALTELTLQSEESGAAALEDAVEHHPWALIIGGFAFLALWSVSALTCFHWVLIVSGQTTNEVLRGATRGRSYVRTRGCRSNCRAAYCAATPASKLPDMSEELPQRV